MTAENAQHLEAELDWLLQLLKARVRHHFQAEDADPGAYETALAAAPDLNGTSSAYSDFVARHRLGLEERIVLLLALAPYIRPQTLDIFLTVKRENGREITEFGGVKVNDRAQFLPTVETALFVLAGASLDRRFHFKNYFTPDHFFIRQGILSLESNFHYRQYITTSILRPSDETIEQFTFGKPQPPAFGSDFPARRIVTTMEWDDLVLEHQTVVQLDEIRAWTEYEHVLMQEWGMGRKLRPGYRSLFYGPPGTGKTLTASLLGKTTGRDVYRIDLSLVVSKYIGETEKNLGRIFDKAEQKNWVLFFDEADALFGKRSQIKDAHDRFANQEVSFLLQRVEDFNGLVILASNAKENMDEAFARRFQSIIYFPMPKPGERLRLWRNAIPEVCQLENPHSLNGIAQQFELAGGSIINVVRYAALMAARRGERILRMADLETGIRREFKKYGRYI